VRLWRRVVSERRGLVVPLLTALLTNVALLVLVVFPLRANVAGDEARASAAKLALTDAERSERVANETRVSKQRADEELKKFYSEVLPSSHAGARDLLYQQLRAISRNTGLAFASSSYEPKAVEDSQLMRFRVDVSLSGEYANIRRFLYDLETAQEFFIIESVKLGESGEEGQSGNSLEVVLQVATYYMGARP